MSRLAARIAARLGAALVVLWLAASAAFLVLQLVPGDPVDTVLGPMASVPEAQKDAIRHDLGLDLPVWQQYVTTVGRMLVGDFGESYQQRQPVWSVIGGQAGPTLALAGLALLLAVAGAAIAALTARTRVLRGALDAGEVLWLSLPVFFTAIVLSTIFSFQLGWLPVTGGSGPAALVLPAVAIALPVGSVLAQVIRHALDAVEREGFAESARARGLGAGAMLRRHGMRHVANPALTMTAYLFGTLIGGAVVVETLFSRPGLGRVALAAIVDRDLPVVMGLVMVSAVVFVALNLVCELLYPLIDPRLRRSVAAQPAAAVEDRP